MDVRCTMSENRISANVEFQPCYAIMPIPFNIKSSFKFKPLIQGYVILAYTFISSNNGKVI